MHSAFAVPVYGSIKPAVMVTQLSSLQVLLWERELELAREASTTKYKQ